MLLTTVSLRVLVMEEVEENGEYRTTSVDSERQPPEHLFSKLLIKVFEDEETNCEPGKGSCQVRHVGNGWRGAFGKWNGSVAVVNGETHVHARCNSSRNNLSMLIHVL